MKTIQQIREEYAKRKQYNDWADLVSFLGKWPNKIGEVCDKVAEIYAKQQASMPKSKLNGLVHFMSCFEDKHLTEEQIEQSFGIKGADNMCSLDAAEAYCKINGIKLI